MKKNNADTCNKITKENNEAKKGKPCS